MQEYKTYMIAPGGKVSHYSTTSYFSDSAAIRAAQQLRRPEQIAQVWRGDHCIYSETDIPEARRQS